jgi:hypothetical protein
MIFDNNLGEHSALRTLKYYHESTVMLALHYLDNGGEYR